MDVEEIEPETDAAPSADEAPSIREAMESAVAAQESKAEPAEVDESGAEPGAEGEAAEPADAKDRDKKGRFAKGVKTASAAAGTAPTDGSLGKGAKTPPAATPPGGPAAPELRPPQSWKPAEREGWASIPAEAKQAVLRREAEVARALQESAPLKRLAQDLANVVTPYQAMIQADNSTPMQAFKALLQTRYALQTAHPQGRAEIIANIMRQFPPDEDHLVAILTGKAGAPGAAQPRGAPPVDASAIAAQVQQNLLRQMGAQRQQALAQRAESEVESWGADKEFFSDVRNRMGALVQAYAEEGTELTFDEAYDLACRSDKQIAGVLKKREAAQLANAGSASTQRARAAASTIKTSSSGSSGAPGEDSLRSDIRKAYLKHVGQ